MYQNVVKYNLFECLILFLGFVSVEEYDYVPVGSRTSEIPVNDDYCYEDTDCIHDKCKQ